MSTAAIVAIIIGAILIVALIAYSATRGRDKRELKRHRNRELRAEGQRERARTDEHRARARARHAEEERAAARHERRAEELDQQGGRRADGS